MLLQVRLSRPGPGSHTMKNKDPYIRPITVRVSGDSQTSYSPHRAGAWRLRREASLEQASTIAPRRGCSRTPRAASRPRCLHRRRCPWAATGRKSGSKRVPRVIRGHARRQPKASQTSSLETSCASQYTRESSVIALAVRTCAGYTG